jgi:WD40 repeat protein
MRNVFARRTALVLLLSVAVSLSPLAQTRILTTEEKKTAPPAAAGGAQTGRPQLVLQSGIIEPVAKADFSGDGALLAAMGSLGNVVKLYEVATGRELLALRAKDGASTFGAGADFMFAADGKSILTHAAGTVRQFDVLTGKLLRELTLFDGRENGWGQFSADGRYLAHYGIESRHMLIRDLDAGGTVIQDFNYQLDPTDRDQNLNAAAFSPDGRMIALSEDSQESMNYRARIVLRDLRGGKVQQTISLETSFPEFNARSMMTGGMPAETTTPLFTRAVKFSSDGRTLILVKRDLLTRYKTQSQTTTYDQAVSIETYDLASGRRNLALPVFPTITKKTPRDFLQSVANSVAIRPDGRRMLVGGNELDARLLDFTSGRKLTDLRGKGFECMAVAYARDGRRAVTADLQGTIRIWDLAKTDAGGEAENTLIIRSDAMGIADVRFAAGGKSLVVASNRSVAQWDLGEGTAARTVSTGKTNPQTSDELLEQPFNSGLSRDGRVYFNVDKNLLKSFDTRTGAELRSIPFTSSAMMLGKLPVSQDGSRVVLAGSLSDISSAGPKPAPTPAPAPKPARPKSPDLKEITRLSKEMEKIQEAYNKAQQNGETAKANELIKEIYAMTAKMMEASGQSTDNLPFLNQGSSVNSKDSGPMMFTGVKYEGVKVVEASTGRDLAKVRGNGPMEIFAQSKALSPDGRLLATAFSATNISIVDVASGRELTALKTDRGIMTQGMIFGADSRLLASYSLETRPGVNQTEMNITSNQRYQGQVRIWDLSDPARGGRVIQTIPCNDLLPALALSPDGRQIAIGSGDVRLYDIASGRLLHTLAGHTSFVHSIDFTADGSMLITAGYDDSIRLWRAATGELLATLVHMNGGADWLVVTPDGLFDGTPAAWSRILWRFSPNIFDVTPVEAYFSDFFYPGLLAEIYAGKVPKVSKDVTQKDRRQPAVNLSSTVIQGAPVSTRKIAVKIDVSESGAGAGARDLRLFRNGTLVRVWRGDLLKGQPRAQFEAEIPIVAGENRLSAYAFNRDNVKSTDAQLALTGAESLRRKGTAYVIACGINQYANPQYNLKYAVADANSFLDELRAQQTRLQQFEKVEVVSLLDQEATKTNFTAALSRLAGGPLPAGAPPALSKLRPAEPEDAVMIYFAGHGTAQGARFYLVPHDLGYTGSRASLSEFGLKMILTRSISDLELERALEAVDAGQLLFVLDACNSGQALEAEEKRRGPMNSAGLAQLAYEKGMSILTAAQSYQVALEAAELGHGYLTFALVEEGLKKGLADRDLKDGQVLTREWFNYATDRVPQMQEKNLGSRILLEEERKKDPATARSVQRPRVFYRREIESRPLIVGKP